MSDRQRAWLLSGHGCWPANMGSLLRLALCFLSISLGLELNLYTLAVSVGNARTSGNSCLQAGMQ